MEKIHHSWSYGSDATVLDDYALTTTMTSHLCIATEFASTSYCGKIYDARKVYDYIFTLIYDCIYEIIQEGDAYPFASILSQM